MLRKVVAYAAATMVGAAVLGVSSLAEGGSVEEASFISACSIIPIFVGIAPFWCLMVTLAGRFAVTALPIYCVSGIIIGAVAGPALTALLPQMMWDSGPHLDYGARWLRDLRFNGGLFAAMGAAAGAVYWLLAVRPKQEPKTRAGTAD